MILYNCSKRSPSAFDLSLADFHGDPMKKLLAFTVASLALLGASQAQAMDELHKKYLCTACHTDATKLVGPAYQDVADKYRADYKKDAKGVITKLSAKVKAGGSG